MKGRNLYFFCIGAFVVLVITLLFLRPVPFSWNPTFGARDKNPFGSYVFDSLLRQAMPAGYRVRNLSWHEIKTDSTARHSNLLFTEVSFSVDESEMGDLLELVDSGMNICIAADYVCYSLTDTLDLKTPWSYISTTGLRTLLANRQVRDTLYWEKDNLFDSRSFVVNDGMTGGMICSDSVGSQPIWQYHAFFLNDEEYGPCVISHRIGRGKLVFVMCPLLFTNYGMLNRDNAQFVLRALSLLDLRRPTIRITDTVSRYSADGDQIKPDTPLQFFVMNKPLRWAIYLALGLVAVFMLLHLRRRQRAIPVVKEPENKQLEFAQLIGTLYYQRGDHADLLRKKYNYFAEHLRRELFVDIDNEADDRDNFQRIALMTSIDERTISGSIRAIRQTVAEEDPFLTTEMLQMYVDTMNKIIRAIQ